MLPDGLDNFQIVVTALFDEAQIDHDVNYSHFTDTRALFNLVLLEHLAQILLKPLHQQLSRAGASLSRRRLPHRLIVGLVQLLLLLCRRGLNLLPFDFSSICVIR